MKKKLIPLIISAVIFIAGCVTAIVGVAQNSDTLTNLPILDPFSISDEDVGKQFNGGVYAEVLKIEDTENGGMFLLTIYDRPIDESDENTDITVICFDAPKSIAYFFENAQYEPVDDKIPFCGTVRKSNEVLNQKAETALWDLYYYYLEIFEGTDVVIDESGVKEIIESISPYYIEVADAANGDIFIWIGSAVMALAVFILLTVLFGKKFLLVFAVLIVIPITILLISIAGKLRTMSTVTEISDGLYKMTCHYDYKCDEFLNADISTIDELIEWTVSKHFFGIPVEIDARNFGCCAFTAETPEGHRLFGRNFDYDETDTLVIYTEPEYGYASYGVVDLKFFDIGTKNGLDGSSVSAKAFMLAAPYVTMDGINEAGVGIGILQLDIPELHQDNGKPDLLITSAIRGVLDKCATVDEAIAFLSDYDMHSFLSRSYHLFITDKTGKSVIVEWTDCETFIVEDTACTNDVMSDNEFYDPDWTCNRYDTIKNKLAEKYGILTADEAMTVASDASWEQSDKTRGTEWSCVYNLDEFSFDICLDRDYETKYSFTREDFR